MNGRNRRQRTVSSRPAALRRLRLLGPGREDVVLVRPDGAVLVAVAHLVAVAERHALRGEERAEERRHLEDLVADQLEEPADLPLGHRAQAQARHVDERPQVRRHHEVRPGRVREDEPGVLARDARADEVAVEVHRALDLRPRTRSRSVGVGVLDRRRQHRRGALERDVALALLVERDAGPMADELVRQRPRHAADPEREDDVLDRRAVARLDDALDQLLLLRRVDLAGRRRGRKMSSGLELASSTSGRRCR